MGLRKAKVSVRKTQDGLIEVLYKGKALEFVAYSQQKKQWEEGNAKNLNQIVNELAYPKKRYKPPQHQPWKRSPGRKGVPSFEFFIDSRYALCG